MKFINIIIGFLSIGLLLNCTGVNSKKNDSGSVNNTRDTLKYASLSDDQLLDTLQKQTINYFWEGAEPTSGLARERLHMDNQYPYHDKNIVTTGGSGFGLMAILVGVERNYITRQQALERYEMIVDYLEKADRFHGAWPHWLVGETGKVQPFSKMDNGGDLVETAYLIQGLIAVKQYFVNGNEREKKLADKIRKLWEDIDWNWYTKGEDVLYWHWSPEYA
ncbi:MAG: beta-glucosidase, partial [Flavobacteriaceae bacterium]|nr:beta-glucosidase [Flavobacteriaceae bacterium]